MAAADGGRSPLDAVAAAGPARARAASSPVALDRHGAWLRALPVEDGRWRIRADLDAHRPELPAAAGGGGGRAVLAAPRRRSRWPSRAPAAAAAAAGAVVSGASTLTMQTARLLEPRPRTLGSKLIEMVRAVQLEARLSKREILALYLTLAPYGGNLEGVRAASLAYFGHEPESLTAGEQALLIALPQSPEARRPDRRARGRPRRPRTRCSTRLVRAGLHRRRRGRRGRRRAAARPRAPSRRWPGTPPARLRRGRARRPGLGGHHPRRRACRRGWRRSPPHAAAAAGRRRPPPPSWWSRPRPAPCAPPSARRAWTGRAAGST